MGTSEIELCSLLIVLACTKFFFEVPETHKNILDHLGGVDTPMGRVPVPRNWTKLSK